MHVMALAIQKTVNTQVNCARAGVPLGAIIGGMRAAIIVVNLKTVFYR